jgi:hypothetical protein
MLRQFKLALASILGWLLPVVAQAERLDPGGGKNTWDFFVYGNGPAIVEILTSLKLLLAPDHGEPIFKYIMLFLAVIGFVVLAARAGFNPQQNFLRMFGFLFVVWFVNYGTTGLRANVNVIDRLNGYSHVVTGVPALVGVPASIVSQTGEWLTRQIEQNFSIPGEITMTGGGAYDLVGRVMSDANMVMFTDDNLKRTVSSYISNCMIPAIAMGRVSVNEFTKSKNLTDTLALGQHRAISTVYFTPENSDIGCVPEETGMGGVASCEMVYTCLREDLENHAEALVDAGAEAWAKTGVFVPLETALSTALSMAGSDAGPFAGYGRPQGYILQRAMISHMGGAFRNAATMTGNNELMMATSVAQAEQSQRTSWAVAASIFNNMMGYVYLVLQAFILAIVPIVIISLMIPGLGAKVFINYGQILIWLTLWSPMLGIINFLIALFWQQQMNSVGLANGLDMYNAGLMTAQTANLQIASQFLGTMVPILAWGLVKGSMAFTEFISSGIGSSFATQAGAQGATGNISMGNLSMDNVGMNKYNTAMSASVGFQDTNAFFNAGTSTSMQQAGGSGISMNAGNATRQSQYGSELRAGQESSTGFNSSQKFAEDMKVSWQNAAKVATSRKEMLEQAASEKESVNSQRSADVVEGVDAGKSSQAGADLQQQAAENRTGAAQASAGGNLQAGAGVDLGKKPKPGGTSNAGPTTPGMTSQPISEEPQSPVTGRIGGNVQGGVTYSQTDQGVNSVSAAESERSQSTLSQDAKLQVRSVLTDSGSSDISFKNALAQAKDFSAEELRSIARSYDYQAQVAMEQAQRWSRSDSESVSQGLSLPEGFAGLSLGEAINPNQTSRDRIQANDRLKDINPEAEYEEASAGFKGRAAQAEGWIGEVQQKTLEPVQSQVTNAPRSAEVKADIDALELRRTRVTELSDELSSLSARLVSLTKDNISENAWADFGNRINDGVGTPLGLPRGHEQGINGVLDTARHFKESVGRFVPENMSEEDYARAHEALTFFKRQVDSFELENKK